MSFEAEFKDEGIKKFFSGLNKKVKDIEGFKTRFAGLISSLVFADVINHFEKEQGSEGKWKAWSSIYKEHMQSIDRGSNKILQDSGRLRQTFSPTSYRVVPQGALWYNNAKISGSDFPYAFAHNEGGPILPKRDFMWLSDNAMEKITDQTLAFILDEAR